MMKFVMLNKTDGTKVWVNPEHVISVTSRPVMDGQQEVSTIRTVSGGYFDVPGDHAYIVERLTKGEQWVRES